MTTPAPDKIPQPLRHVLYNVGVVISIILFVVMAAIGSGLISGELATKWVAFLSTLTGIGGLGMASAYSKPETTKPDDAGAISAMQILIILGIAVLAVVLYKLVDINVR